MSEPVWDEPDEFAAPDPDAAPKHKTESGLPSIYAAFRAELQKPADLPKDIVLRVPGRESLAVRYSVDLPLDKLHRWQKAARKKKNDPTSQIDTMHFNLTVLQEQCISLVFNGEDVTDKEDEPLTFKNEAFQEQLGALDARGAIKEFYVRDPYVLRASADILTAAGYSQDDANGFAEGEDEDDPLD